VRLILLLLLLLCVSLAVSSCTPVDAAPPPVTREFRGVWIATVANLDWPSKPGLSTDAQQAELRALLDRAAELNFNAVVFQVRPSGDALYASQLEPWSEFLTGQQGQPPRPYYDPLEFAIHEAQQWGLELHVWCNPFRARHPKSKGPLHDTHLGKSRPALVKKYGPYLWMDPGEPEVQEHSLAVMLDVVKRYDIDGIHLDDYFYPYREKNSSGKVIDFPDEASFARYKKSGGKLTKADWRRSNVDSFVRKLYERVKAEKPWVKVGVSPFGIWRPGHPPQIKGMDPYAELYADSRKWLREGWCDYMAPQLYWPVGQAGQDFSVLLGWWDEQNIRRRHLWPGLITSKVGEGSKGWDAEVILEQMHARQKRAGATGEIHFRMQGLMKNGSRLNSLIASAYRKPALVPASPWLDQTAPVKPLVHRAGNTLTWTPQGQEQARLWLVQYRTGENWTTRILGGAQTRLELPPRASEAAVRAIDRCGNESAIATLR